mgnify:CR=1 FL=1
MQRPEAYIDFAVYEDSVDLIGIANVTLPAITYMLVSITGAGVGGTVETPLAGMIDAMTMTMNFHSATGAAASLAAPKKHQIDLRAAEQHWNTTTVDKEVIADKYVMTIVPKSFSPGTIAPASASDASGEYSVYYYAAYKDGETLWEIDPFNQIFNVKGVDYWADIRKALGK